MCILFISPCYYNDDKNRLPILTLSLMEQRRTDWRLILVHDGPGPLRTNEFIRSLRDPRIEYKETLVRKRNYGHPIRDLVLNDLKDPNYQSDCTHIIITNPDNYYAPGFIDNVMEPFKNPLVKAAYCEYMVHNYVNWNILPGHHESSTGKWIIDDGRIHLGCIDIGQVIFERKEIVKVGWPYEDHSSDFTVINEVKNNIGEENFIKVKNVCLFVHN